MFICYRYDNFYSMPSIWRVFVVDWEPYGWDDIPVNESVWLVPGTLEDD